MAKGDWWFKFEYLKWLTDEQLNRCSLATQGFWLRCICVMRKSGTGTLSDAGPELCRLLSVTPAELKRCFAELLKTKAADVTVRHASVTQKSAIFTLMSRKIQRELKVKEQNRLRKQRERRHAKVTDVSQDRVKSNKKEVRKEEELREASPSAIAPTPGPKITDSRKSHPAIVALHAVTGVYPPKEIWDEIIDRLGIDVDIGKLKKCFTAWRVRGYNKTNYDWAMDWYLSGIPEIGKGAKNGTQRQSNNANVGKYVPNPPDELPPDVCATCFGTKSVLVPVPEDRRQFSFEMESARCPDCLDRAAEVAV